MPEATIYCSSDNCRTPDPGALVKRLLLVEDEKEIADWLKNSLTGKVDFSWARNLQEAQSEIEENIPEILILDLKLPDGKGVDLLKKIRQKQMKITVYVFSVDSALKNTCLRLGAEQFFDKIGAENKLLEAIQQQL